MSTESDLPFFHLAETESLGNFVKSAVVEPVASKNSGYPKDSAPEDSMLHDSLTEVV